MRQCFCSAESAQNMLPFQGLDEFGGVVIRGRRLALPLTITFHAFSVKKRRAVANAWANGPFVEADDAGDSESVVICARSRAA